MDYLLAYLFNFSKNFQVTHIVEVELSQNCLIDCTREISGFCCKILGNTNEFHALFLNAISMSLEYKQLNKHITVLDIIIFIQTFK